MKTPRLGALAGLSILLALLVFVFFRGVAPERIAGPGETPPPADSAAEPFAVKETRQVTLFFLREDDGLLVPEVRDIAATGSVAAESEALLVELIKGSAGGLLSALPSETKLRQVFLTKDGIAYADFTKDLTAVLPAGTDAERAAIYAVVDSLAFNFKAIKKVFILIDGEERETLNGHLTLDRAYLPDYSLIAKN
jgi:spore germination protein GerM